MTRVHVLGLCGIYNHLELAMDRRSIWVGVRASIQRDNVRSETVNGEGT